MHVECFDQDARAFAARQHASGEQVEGALALDEFGRE
jgi:hypothetical protein